MLAIALAAALTGAFGFGAWHIPDGGLVRGDSRAAAFGVGLSGSSALALVVVWLVGRRLVGRTEA